ncbi:hypothetical protein, partial [Jeotgalibaca porci]|uniref:hypothetical protein n=1 Tax=Jeotgalibaca porci TaxID=1868793 RepID=UPI0035A08F13
PRYDGILITQIYILLQKVIFPQPHFLCFLEFSFLTDFYPGFTSCPEPLSQIMPYSQILFFTPI